jgi:hypothetical protein
MRIGIVACGYADGYPRHCGTDTPVLVDGVRTGTVGRVSMDMLARRPDAGAAGRHRQRGHAVGPRPAGQPLAIDDVARAAGTIGYELMCALAPRVPVTRCHFGITTLSMTWITPLSATMSVLTTLARPPSRRRWWPRSARCPARS